MTTPLLDPSNPTSPERIRDLGLAADSLADAVAHVDIARASLTTARGVRPDALVARMDDLRLAERREEDARRAVNVLAIRWHDEDRRSGNG